MSRHMAWCPLLYINKKNLVYDVAHGFAPSYILFQKNGAWFHAWLATSCFFRFKKQKKKKNGSQFRFKNAKYIYNQ